MKFELNITQYDPCEIKSNIKYFPVTRDSQDRYILDIEINPQRALHAFSLSEDRKDLKTLYWGFQWIGSVTQGTNSEDIPHLMLNTLARNCFKEWRELPYSPSIVALKKLSFFNSGKNQETNKDIVNTSATNDIAHIFAYAKMTELLEKSNQTNTSTMM